MLIISRERLEVATSCEIGIYLQDQLAARLFQEQSTSFNLPPGNVSEIEPAERKLIVDWYRGAVSG